MNEKTNNEFALNLCASALTCVTNVGAFNPMDCLRLRWQTQRQLKRGSGGVAEKSVSAFARRIVREEGLWRGLWSPGLMANIAAITTSSGIKLAFYPYARDALIDAGMPAGSAMFASGFGCGMVGYWCSTPLWLCKARLQNEAGSVSPRYSNRMTPVIAQVVHEEGARRLWKGATAFCFRGAFLSAAQMFGYNFSKEMLLEKNGGVFENDGTALHLVASVNAALLATTLGTPLDVIVARYQTAPKGTYDSALECAVSMHRAQGAAVFLRGWTVLFARLLPSYLTSFPLYEQLRRWMGIGFL